jgi:DNA-binding MurR/RpiR family transcriptional regulator
MQLTQMKHFTPNEKLIASYILEQRERMLNLTVQELAAATFTSHSAIHRLSQKLELAGYKDFIINLAKEFQKNDGRISNIDPNYPFSLGESILQVATDIAELMKETIEKNLASLDEKLLSQAVEMLNSAERIFIYAIGDSQIRAKSFQNKMFKINKYAVIATELSEWAYHTLNLTSKDCAIFLSYHVTSSNFVRVAHYLRQENIPLITVSATSSNELPDLSNVIIQIPNDEEKLAKIGTFSSQIAFEFVLNVIYSCIYKLDYEKFTSLNSKQSNIHNSIKDL